MRVRRVHTIRWIIILLFSLSALLGGYAVVNVLLLDRTQQFTTSAAEDAQAITANPVITDLPVGGLLSRQWFAQDRLASIEIADQVVGVANQLVRPFPPTKVVATDTQLGNRVLLTWVQPAGQLYDGVEIYRSTTEAQKSAELLATVPEATGSWFDLTVTNETTYYYWLKSYRNTTDASLTSEWSDTVSVVPTDATPPLPPGLVTVRSLTAEDQTVGVTAGLYISWQPSNTIDVSHYVLYRSSQPGVLGTAILETKPDVTTAIDPTVEPGVSYYYAVTAVDVYGNESSQTLLTSVTGNSAPFIDLSNGN